MYFIVDTSKRLEKSCNVGCSIHNIGSSIDLAAGSDTLEMFSLRLLLGQHVYIRLARVNELTQSRVLMPENYLMSVRYNEQTLITSADVWCVDAEGKLTKREVVLGEYVMSQGCYVVLSGLEMDDYVADPTNPDCAEGVMTDVRSEEDFVIPETEPWESYPSGVLPGQTLPETTGFPDEDEDVFPPTQTTAPAQTEQSAPDNNEPR